MSQDAESVMQLMILICDAENVREIWKKVKKAQELWVVEPWIAKCLCKELGYIFQQIFLIILIFWRSNLHDRELAEYKTFWRLAGLTLSVVTVRSQAW